MDDSKQARAPGVAELLAELATLDRNLLELWSLRGRTALALAARARAEGVSMRDVLRRTTTLGGATDEWVARNPGPFDDAAIARLGAELGAHIQSLLARDGEPRLAIRRRPDEPDRVLAVAGHSIGGTTPVLIAGPCAVESAEQIDGCAAFLAARGVRFLRGGAYKPRTSPHDFQGLGTEGLELLSRAARAHGMASVTEVLDPRHVERVSEHADVLQVGARNMQNFALLREVGGASKPVVLKRGLAATLEEFIHAAEHVLAAGNARVILCERGIRTFEPSTRATLDVSAIALLRQEVALPVIADVSHPAGRRDILAPLARAALAAGAQGLMLEVHPSPSTARSDAEQQLDFAAFERFVRAVWPAGLPLQATDRVPET